MRSFFHPVLAIAALLGLTFCSYGQDQEPDKVTSEARLVIQIGHTDKINSAAFSPDGKRMMTGSQDGTARLWDTQTGKELLMLQGHTKEVRAVAFSPDGQRVLTASFDSTARLWDSLTGKELLAIKGHKRYLFSAAFSPDGKHLLTGAQDGTARLWDAQSGKEQLVLKHQGEVVHAVAFSPDSTRLVTSDGKSARVWDAQNGKEVLTLQGHSEAVLAVAFSPDGKRILTGSQDHTARLWNASTGKEVRAFRGHTDTVFSVAFGPDDTRLLTGSFDRTARLWNTETGKELHVLRGHQHMVYTVAYSPDGEQVLTGSWDKTARLWDVQSGKLLGVLRSRTSAVTSAVFSPDGQRLLLGGADKTARLWDTQSGKELIVLKSNGIVNVVAFSPDGNLLLTGSADKVARLWDAQTGKELLTLKEPPAPEHALERGVIAAAFALDGKRVLTGHDDGAVRLWNTQTGKELLVLKDKKLGGRAVAFSPDGKRFLTTGGFTAYLWNAQTGKELLNFKGHRSGIEALAFSPDGKRIVTAGLDRTLRVWNAETGGKELLVLHGHTSPLRAVAFAPDGKTIVSSSVDATARLWDAQTGKEVRKFEGHAADVTSVAFAPNGKIIVTGSADNTARVWDTKTGNELCRLACFRNGTWAVSDRTGRYDASNAGDVDGLHWVVGLEPIALYQLKERYYEPGLLAKRLGLNQEPVRDVPEFRDVKLFPKVAVAQADPKTPQFDVDLTNSGGGIGRVAVLVNGKELTHDARPNGTDAKSRKLALKVDLSKDARVVPGKKNKVEVLAYNADGSLASRGLVREFDGPGATEDVKPSVYAVVVGVSKYQGDKLNLRYAAKDAEDFATALRLAADRLFGADRVHVTLLTATNADSRPTRAALVKALDALKTTKPGDLVIVYLAGHGVTQGGQDGDWHYLTADAQSGDLGEAAVRKAVSLSSADLTDLLKQSPARKQVLILDTCHSGRVVEKLTEKRDVPGSQVRALERVKDRTGMHVLAGCAADAVSYEASKYGQGLLTYSLLLGMQGAKLREGQYVDIIDLFGFAADKVPELARDIGGVQRPTIASPRGASFDVGQLTAEDRAKVPLQQVKPVIVKVNLQDEDQVRDVLGLANRVNDRLRDASAVPRGAKLVFVDSDVYPGGYLATGRYKQSGDKVVVTLKLFEGEKLIATITAEGTKGQPDELAAKIAEEVEKKLVTSSGK